MGWSHGKLPLHRTRHCQAHKSCINALVYYLPSCLGQQPCRNHSCLQFQLEPQPTNPGPYKKMVWSRDNCSNNNQRSPILCHDSMSSTTATSTCVCSPKLMTTFIYDKYYGLCNDLLSVWFSSSMCQCWAAHQPVSCRTWPQWNQWHQNPHPCVPYHQHLWSATHWEPPQHHYCLQIQLELSCQ